MNACGIKKYNPLNYGHTVYFDFVDAIEEGTPEAISDFIEELSDYKLKYPKETNHNATTDYSQSENAKALRALVAQLKGTLEEMMPGVDSIKKKLGIIKQIEESLNILDKTNEDTYTKELKALDSSHKDENLDDIEQHFYDTYGRSSYSLISTVKQSFADRILKEAFFDSDTGTLTSIDNSELNRNINAFKYELFENIWGYLRKEYSDFAALRLIPMNAFEGRFMTNPRAYGIVMNAFYGKVLSSSDIKDRLRSERSNSEINNRIQSKKKQFSTLVEKILKDNVLGDKIKGELLGKNYTDIQIDSLKNSLYSDGKVSKIAQDLLSVLQKFEGQSDIVEDLKSIFYQDYSLLGAAMSYTQLTQFDALLEDSFGGDIRIKKNTKGKEGTGQDKYSYGRDRAHEIKGWETSDNNDALKNTSRFAKTVIGSIRVYDNKTNRYKNKRVTPTSLVLSARKVIDSLAFGAQSIRTGYDHGDGRVKLIGEAVKKFHLNPIENAYILFNELFGARKGGNIRPADVLGRSRRGINEHDIDILYSIFKAVFDESNPNSFYNQASSTLIPYKQRQNAYALLAEIAGYIDRTVDASYSESSINYGADFIPTFTIKRKFFDHADLSRLQRGITHFSNSLSNPRRAELISKKEYDYTEGDVGNEWDTFSVTIGGRKMTLSVHTKSPGGIMSTSTDNSTFHSQFIIQTENEGTTKIAIDDLSELKGINLDQLNNKLIKGDELEDNEQLYLDILKFLEDTTGISFRTNHSEFLPVLSNLNALFESSSRSEKEKFTNPLQMLMRIGMRTLYEGKRHIGYESSETKKNGKSFREYLNEEAKDRVYKDGLGQPKLSIINTRYNSVSYNNATFKDKILDMFIEAQMISRGDVLQSTTKDSEGNSIPNSSIARLGSNIHHYLYRDDVETAINGKPKKNAYGYLAFYGDKSWAITAITQDLEVRNINGDVKKVSSMSPRELIYHSLINRFASPIAHKESIAVQPVVYSDKINIMTYSVSPNLLNQETSSLNERGVLGYSMSDYIGQYQNTIGEYFSKIKENTEETLIAAVQKHFSGIEITKSNYIENMQRMSEGELVEAAYSIGATVELNKDYIVVKNKAGGSVVTPNPLVEHNALVFSDATKLKELLETQLKQFIKDVLSTGVTFNANGSHSPIAALINKKEGGRSIASILVKSEERGSLTDEDYYKKQWVDKESGMLILAKHVIKEENGEQIKKNIVYEKDFDDNIEGLEVNPLLMKFFLFDGFASNNLRLSLVGSELNMGHGKSSPLTQAFQVEDVSQLAIMLDIKDSKVANEVFVALSQSFDYYSLKMHIDKSNYSREAISKLEGLLWAHNLYQSSFTQNAQGKRNVIIPATLQYPTQGHINGMPRQTRVAVIKDASARANSYSGDSKDIDSADGSARMTPFQVIMENHALGSQAVGTVRKPIWHDIDLGNGTSFLAKFAAMGMTNEDMRHSSMSKISLHNIFKKATNLQWMEGDVDLLKDIENEHPFTDERQLKAWFSSHILNSERLFYTDPYGDVREITLLSRGGNGIYYTVERGKNIEEHQVFHMFDASGKHYTFSSEEDAINARSSILGLHTINSLFELHTALGGIYSSGANGKYNEFNNEVVVNFMNRIGSRREGAGKSLSQSNYRQPLKEYHTGYILNETATKKGAKNINQASSWYDDTHLTTFTVMSDGLGIQLNADHDVVDSEITEFSQVIAAAAAYGYTYEQASDIYEGLAKAAIEGSSVLSNAIDSFITANINEKNRTTATSDLYQAIGQIILTAEGRRYDDDTLGGIIKEVVGEVFQKNNVHTNDEIKIPFSDTTMYNNFLTTMVSEINSNSIKRKHSGVGAVLVPSYDTIQYFEVPTKDGGVEKLMASDVLRRARIEYRGELITILSKGFDESEKDKYRSYTLSQLLNEITADVVETSYYIKSTDKAEVNKHLMSTYLKKHRFEPKDISYFMPSDIVDVYYNGAEEDEPVATIDLNDLKTYYAFKSLELDIFEDRDISGFVFRQSSSSPVNLKPSTIRWQYVDGAGNTKYANAFDLKAIKDSFNLKEVDTLSRRKAVQEALHLLHSGKFSLDGVDELQVIDGTLENKEAEIIMGNIFKDNFDIGDASLNDVVSQGAEVFKKKTKAFYPPIRKDYDIAFTKSKNGSTLISFSPADTSANSGLKEIPFKRIRTDKKGNIYAVAKGRELFQIGKWVKAPDGEVRLDKESNKLISDTGEDVSKYKIHNGTILKRVDYVKRYVVNNQSGLGSVSELQRNDVLYTVTLEEGSGSEVASQDFEKARPRILNEIYNSSSHFNI